MVLRRDSLSALIGRYLGYQNIPVFVHRFRAFVRRNAYYGQLSLARGRNAEEFPWAVFSRFVY